MHCSDTGMGRTAITELINDCPSREIVTGMPIKVSKEHNDIHQSVNNCNKLSGLSLPDSLPEIDCSLEYTRAISH
jgi:hypothetical protein